jgi:ornithine cyclodeaminase/alanine dehydrogenase-like protein (mu-crystallin family)
VRAIEQVSVWARSPEKAHALAESLRAQGFQAAAVADLRVACGQADIVSCATLATAPVVHGAWLRPGTHLDLIGSFTPAMREADDACFAGAGLYLDSGEALKKSGDLTGPLERGVITRGDVHGTLADLSRGAVPGRSSGHERTVFKSVGNALEDLAAAMLVVEATP